MQRLDVIRVGSVQERPRPSARKLLSNLGWRDTSDVLLRQNVPVQDKLSKTALEESDRLAGRRRLRCLESKQNTGQSLRAASTIPTSSATQDASPLVVWDTGLSPDRWAMTPNRADSS